MLLRQGASKDERTPPIKGQVRDGKGVSHYGYCVIRGFPSLFVRVDLDRFYKGSGAVDMFC